MNIKTFAYDLNASHEIQTPGMVFRYRVRYDWASIVEQDFNESNFVVEPLGFVDALACDPLSLEDWARQAMRQLLNKYTGASEIFLSELPADEQECYASARATCEALG